MANMMLPWKTENAVTAERTIVKFVELLRKASSRKSMKPEVKGKGVYQEQIKL